MKTNSSSSTIEEILAENPEVKIKQTVSALIEDDMFPVSPRDAYDHIAKMICSDGRYNLGDASLPPSQNPIEYIAEELEIDFDEDQYDVSDLIAQIKDKAFISPLSLYEHSGISLSMGHGIDRFDSRNVGFIYMEKSKADELIGDGTNKEKAFACMEAETKEYDTYLRGENYTASISQSLAIETASGQIIIKEEYDAYELETPIYSLSSSETAENYLDEYIYEALFNIENGITRDEIKDKIPTYISSGEKIQVLKEIPTRLLDLPQTFKERWMQEAMVEAIKSYKLDRIEESVSSIELRDKILEDLSIEKADTLFLVKEKKGEYSIRDARAPDDKIKEVKLEDVIPLVHKEDAQKNKKNNKIKP